MFNLEPFSSIIDKLSLSLIRINGVYSVADKTVLVVVTIIILYGSYVMLKPSRERLLRKELSGCYKDLEKMIKASNCQPIMLRLAWSDAVTYDSSLRHWPNCGGVNGSIRSDLELNINTNAGLSKAISLLNPISKRYRSVSWADLIQMAAVISIHSAGGPFIELNYGRVDAPAGLYEVDEDDSATPSSSRKGSGRVSKYLSTSAGSGMPILPCPAPPYPDGAPSADVHIRNIFYRLGLNNRDTVVLCGAHTIGRGFKDRTGVCPFSSGDQGATIYTKQTALARADGQPGIGMAGGCSWTKNWLTFDNSYFQRVVGDHSSPSTTSSGVFSTTTDQLDASQLMWLPTDQALYDCPEYRPYFLRYAADQGEFFRDFSAAYLKMSELGAKFRGVVRLTAAEQGK